MIERTMSPRFSFVCSLLSAAPRELKCMGRTVTWPFDGPSIPISQRRMPIQVTTADSTIARRAVAYLEEVELIGSRIPCTAL